MPLININEYKAELLSDICNTQTIIDAIDSTQTDVDNSQPMTLLYNNIFPYMQIPSTQNKVDTYIMLSVDIDRINRHNKSFATYGTTIWVLAHMERMKMPAEYNATRIDYLSQELKTLFDGVRKFGFSPLDLISNREVLLNETYHYRELRFMSHDLRHPQGIDNI